MQERILVYGLQSSGASFYAYCRAQQMGCIGVVDLWASEVAPSWRHFPESVVLKTTVTLWDLDTHEAAFRPTRTILFLRNPLHNYVSLKQKQYRNLGGPIPYKFEKLNRLFLQRSRLFDEVVLYEEFIDSPISLRYSFDEFLDFTLQNAWCRENYMSKWGMGNLHHVNNPIAQVEDEEVRPKSISYRVEPEDVAFVARHAPDVLIYYQQRGLVHIPAGTVEHGWPSDGHHDPAGHHAR